MFGLDIAMAGVLWLAGEELSCPQKPAPKVTVTPRQSVVKYDSNKTRQELEQFNIDTVSPYEIHTETHVGGLMSGEILIETRIGFVLDTFVNRGLVCIAIRNVDVNLHLAPTVYVAKEFKRGTCKYDAILEHENKHVSMDKYILKKYSDRMLQAVSQALEKYGASYGPFEETKQEEAQEKLKNYIDQIVKAESETMSKERRERQQGIDSLEEYERVNKLCR